VELEQRGIPAVALVTEQFAAVARASATARGLPDLPVVVFPADLEEHDRAAVAAATRERWPAIRAALRR
jgi:hypothetical protein